MDSDESYHSESEFYYPNEEDKENNAEETQPSFAVSDVSEINKNVIHRPWSVRIGKNCALFLLVKLPAASSRKARDLGHSFSQHGPPGW